MPKRKAGRWGWVIPLLAILFVWNVITDDDDEPAVARPTAVKIQPAPPTELPRVPAAHEVPAPVPLAALYVIADTLNVRSEPAKGGAVIAKLGRGTQVQISHRSGEWYGATLTDGSIGWLHGDYLSNEVPVVATALKSTPVQPAYDRGEVLQAIIRSSLASYSGRCPCPYNRMSNGSQCGGRSAYSKPGGASPLCYPSDVSEAMVEDFIRRQAN